MTSKTTQPPDDTWLATYIVKAFADTSQDIQVLEGLARKHSDALSDVKSRLTGLEVAVRHIDTKRTLKVGAASGTGAVALLVALHEIGKGLGWWG